MKNVTGILPLPKENSPILMPNLHTQKVMHQVDLLHLKLRYKSHLTSPNEPLLSYDEEIIYMQYQNDEILPVHQIVEVWINLTLLEAQVLQVCVNPGIPSSRSFLLSIQHLPQETHMSIPPEHLKSLGLLNINLLLQYAIHKCGLYIHLVDAPTHLCRYGHDRANGSISGYWGERLIIVNALNL